eukprot:2208409-Pyramimonas_sp.AAC.1
MMLPSLLPNCPRTAECKHVHPTEHEQDKVNAFPVNTGVLSSLLHVRREWDAARIAREMA